MNTKLSSKKIVDSKTTAKKPSDFHSILSARKKLILFIFQPLQTEATKKTNIFERVHFAACFIIPILCRFNANCEERLKKKAIMNEQEKQDLSE